ncbi:hypothetical protein G5C51_34610 [Streptomyces sp. A7024]|uniref:Uncharacterized protein n=1 Tax=Streptomyces coryli TaxID=1128680 RepID=A0A6G4UCA0_9ACTN|nr:hypothetical protein [Streptomyces coryli]NGN69008.1 hypothetical protein [Streptomyces coryli]
MDDLFSLFDDLLAELGDVGDLPIDIDFDAEFHWVPVQLPDGLTHEHADILELRDEPPPGGEAGPVESMEGVGVQWVAFRNPFHEMGP